MVKVWPWIPALDVIKCYWSSQASFHFINREKNKWKIAPPSLGQIAHPILFIFEILFGKIHKIVDCIPLWTDAPPRQECCIHSGSRNWRSLPALEWKTFRSANGFLRGLWCSLDHCLGSWMKQMVLVWQLVSPWETNCKCLFFQFSYYQFKCLK